MTRVVCLVSLLVLSACGPAAVPVAVNDGYFHLNKSGTFTCPAQPVSIDGDRRDITLDGTCRQIRITGSRNDVVVYVPPNASIDVTGNRNTVVYRLIRAGAKPRWTNTGDSNELLRNSRAPWMRDRDWYQEQRK